MDKVKIYSTPTCPYCKMAKDYLAEKGIEFEDTDVASNVEARQEMVDASHQLGVPVIVADGQVVIGFDKARLDEILKLK